MYSSIIEKIEQGRRFLVVSHVNPEGDALGSQLGLTLALRAAGKDAVAYAEEELPETLTFLPGAETVVHDLTREPPFNVTIAVDCGQKSRLGDGFVEFDSKGATGTLINIDHHTTNDSFGDLNVIEEGASAAGEMVYDLLKAADMEVTPEVATNLYVAIHTDTGGFRYNSSTAGAFRKAGDLVDLGADPWEVSLQVYENQPVERFILLGQVLSTLDIVGEGDLKVATVLVTLEMLESVNGTRELSDGFVNYARSIKGVEVGLLFRESAPGEYKVSLRSKGRVDVAALSMHFGGGGHKNAAGFNIKGSLEEVKERLNSALNEQLDVAAR